MHEKHRVLNRDVIKYIAMITMLLNHISTVFMESGTLLAELFLDIGYFTAITMCYFLVEGFHHYPFPEEIRPETCRVRADLRNTILPCVYGTGSD